MISRFTSSLPFLIGFVLAIGVVEIVNASMGHQLNAWGIFPRSVHGLAGIPLAPFLHGGIGHVISNSIPFLVLGGIVLLRVSFIQLGRSAVPCWFWYLKTLNWKLILYFHQKCGGESS